MIGSGGNSFAGVMVNKSEHKKRKYYGDPFAFADPFAKQLPLALGEGSGG
jgi:hypothetical protein